MAVHAVRIACLAWGSLIWKPGALPLAAPWRPGGPRLPLAFARVGDKGELAVALCPRAPDAPTYWTELALDDLDRARELLREREEVDPERPDGIGSVPARGAAGAWDARIAAWAADNGIDAVIWTALPPRSAGEEGRTPSADEAVAYLDHLQGDVRRHAESYVRQVPPDIRTPYRDVIEARLGWAPRAGSEG